MQSLRRNRRSPAFLPPTSLSTSAWISPHHPTATCTRRAARAATFRMTSTSETASETPPPTPEQLSAAAAKSAAASDKLDAAEMPAPVTPSQPMDPSLGDETALITVSEDRPADADDTWLSSVMNSAGTISAHHPLASMRAQALDDVKDLPVPSRRMESWRFTDLRAVYASRYVANAPVDREEIVSFDLRQYAPDTAGVVLVFVDGVFDEGLSIVNDDSAEEWAAAGGYFGSADKYQGDAEVVRKILTDAELGKDGEGGLFPTVAHAIATDAAILDIPDNFSVSRPVAVVFVSTTGVSPQHAKASAARLAIIAGQGSKLSVLEAHVSLDKESSYSLTLATTAVLVKDNSSVSHYLLDDTCMESHVLATVHAEVREGGNYELRTFGLGSKVERFTVGVDLVGSESNGLVYGSLIADGYQIADIHSRICHNARGTTSDQLQKNVAADHARAIFKGKIVVTKDGPETESSQLCRSLLLSNKAYVDAMPVLEIANDDVMCSHGATVSDLQDDELFYCQSRGINYQKAQFLLITGFAMEILGDCPFPNLRALLAKKMESVAATALKREWNKKQFTSI